MVSILFWTASHLPDIGGFQWSTYRLACSLKQLGHKPRFVARTSGQPWLEPEVPEVRFEAETVRGWAIKSGEWLLNHRNEFDLIHVIDCFYDAVDEQLAVLERLKLPSVLKVPTEGCIERLMTSANRVSALGKISAFAILNEGIARELACAGMDPKKFWFIPNGVGSDRFKPCRNRAGLREKLGLPPGKITLLFAGRLVGRKRLDILLSAMERLPEYILVIVGSGFGQRDSVEGDVRRRVASMRNVILREPTPNILPYFQSSDIHVLVSEREGMSNSVLEGMSCGIPTVASAISGIREIIEPGKDGFLVPVGNVLATAEAISQLAKSGSTRERMGKAARQKIKKQYDIGIIAAAYEKLYQHICAK